MPSLKGRVVRLFSSLVAPRGTIVEARDVGGFRRLVVRCDVRVTAGTKVQLLLPTDDMRTYSPVPSPGGMLLLGWKHAGGPGARWMAEAREGDEVRFVGPQRSLEIEAGPLVLVGDETSVAVAAAFAASRPSGFHAVLQAGAVADVREAADSVELSRAEIVAAGDTAATVEAILAKVGPDASVALTGGSELVVAVRDALRRAQVPRIKTKTYWVRGKTGLD